MAWTGLKLTVDGQNALSMAQLANGMDIKSVVVGDGQPPANFRTLKRLVHQLYEITELKIDTGENGTCTITVDIPKVEYDYYFREIGVIITTVSGEKLSVYDTCADDAQYIVSTTGVETTKKRIRLTVNVSDVADITLSNPSILYVGYDDYEQTVGRLEEAIVATAEEAAEALDAHVKDMDNPHQVKKSDVGLCNVDNTADTKKPVSEAQQAAIDAVKKLLNDAFNSHAGDKSNPHKVTKAQVGLGNADDTADINKPISTAQQAALDALYQQLTAYTNQKIADLINGAPSTLDTLKEVADAIAAHKTIMDALDAAIGKKASAAEFDSHAQDTTKHVTAAQQASWTGKLAPTGDASNVISAFSQASSRANLTSKEKLSVSLGKIMKWLADLANGAASSLLGTNLTANRALVANTGGKVAASSVTATELGYLTGVTSGIQGQFNELNTHIGKMVYPYDGYKDIRLTGIVSKRQNDNTGNRNRYIIFIPSLQNAVNHYGVKKIKSLIIQGVVILRQNEQDATGFQLVNTTHDYNGFFFSIYATSETDISGYLCDCVLDFYKA